jgi:hypothetical protein
MRQCSAVRSPNLPKRRFARACRRWSATVSWIRRSSARRSTWGSWASRSLRSTAAPAAQCSWSPSPSKNSARSTPRRRFSLTCRIRSPTIPLHATGQMRKRRSTFLVLPPRPSARTRSPSRGRAPMRLGSRRGRLGTATAAGRSRAGSCGSPTVPTQRSTSSSQPSTRPPATRGSPPSSSSAISPGSASERRKTSWASALRARRSSSSMASRSRPPTSWGFSDRDTRSRLTH